MKKEKSDQNAVAELTREGLYKENKWLWEENRNLKEYNGELIENHKKDIAILCEENKKLKEKLSEITMVADDEKQSIEHILELEEENKKLKEELGEYKKMFEDHLKECYIKNTAEFLDKKFTLEKGFMEEDTLQELRDLGKI